MGGSEERLDLHLRARVLVCIVVASLRVLTLTRGLDMHETVRRLRRGRSLPPNLRDPRLYGHAVGRISRLLPPWRMGGCLKRALILLHLWSRCGLTVRLHIGAIRRDRRTPRGHAWLSGTGLPAGDHCDPVGHAEIAVL